MPVQIENALFDAVRDDKAIDRDGPTLADAVGPIGCLVLDCRVPPWVEMDDKIGCREIEAGPSCFQADEEEIAITGLKCRDARSALRRGTAPSRYW